MSKVIDKISIKTKKPWEVSRGHQGHQSGSGQHDSRPKRQRTRAAQKRRALKDWQE